MYCLLHARNARSTCSSSAAVHCWRPHGCGSIEATVILRALLGRVIACTVMLHRRPASTVDFYNLAILGSLWTQVGFFSKASLHKLNIPWGA
jgi:hypothetical protein